MAPLVEMLPTNFFPDEPPSVDAEPELEVDPDPELELEPEPEDPPELDPEPELDEPEELPLEEEPELVPPLDAAVEPDEDAVEADPEDEVLLDASPSAPEPEPCADPPASSPCHWVELPDEPHASTNDAAATRRRKHDREARFIDIAVTSRRETRQRIGVRLSRVVPSAPRRDGFLAPPPLRKQSTERPATECSHRNVILRRGSRM